ncbi:GNAT family N-acetyltransferase [Shimia sp.]|uniref:GNAT family N-acetyltransferase n=1 Tax=Shimia sp. TaxID=1954381 RepID=UPI003568D540
MAGQARGYRSPAYLAALAGLGRPVTLAGGAAALIARPIPGSARADLMGPYPFLSSDDWPALLAALAEDRTEDGGDYVTLGFVTDPFCPLPLDAFARRFDIARVLNDQYIVDLAAPPAPSRHHRRQLRRPRPGLTLALRAPTAADAAAFADLYASLVARKAIRDFRAFDRASLIAQAQVPGALIVEARIGGRLAGIDLYYVDGPRAHAHLSAYDALGYGMAVSYPMMEFAIRALAAHARVLNLGGAPATGGAGIGHFKRGWTGSTRPSFFCGRVLDPAAYARLAGAAFAPGGHFPAYRSGEFAASPPLTAPERP